MVLNVSLLCPVGCSISVIGTSYCDAKTCSSGDGVFKWQCIGKNVWSGIERTVRRCAA